MFFPIQLAYSNNHLIKQITNEIKNKNKMEIEIRNDLNIYKDRCSSKVHFHQHSPINVITPHHCPD